MVDCSSGKGASRKNKKIHNNNNNNSNFAHKTDNMINVLTNFISISSNIYKYAWCSHIRFSALKRLCLILTEIKKNLDFGWLVFSNNKELVSQHWADLNIIEQYNSTEMIWIAANRFFESFVDSIEPVMFLNTKWIDCQKISVVGLALFFYELAFVQYSEYVNAKHNLLRINYEYQTKWCMIEKERVEKREKALHKEQKHTYIWRIFLKWMNEWCTSDQNDVAHSIPPESKRLSTDTINKNFDEPQR